MRRIFACILALVMCLALFPMAAVAADSDFEIKDGELVKYQGPEGHVEIPYGITSIGAKAFSDYYRSSNGIWGKGLLTSVTIPDSVTEIASGAFSGTDLKSVTIPDSVVNLGGSSGNVFSFCDSLESVTIGSGVTNLAGETFYACKNLKSVTLSDSVTNIGSKAFYSCSSLNDVRLGGGVKRIGENAFKGCKSLPTIDLGSSLVSIATRAFEGCESLKSITIPGSVIADIGEYAFRDCTSLTDLKIDNGLTGIGRYAFQNCTSLKSVTIPASVTDIGLYAFTGCTSLESVTFLGFDTTIGAYAIANPNLKTIYGLTGSKAEKHADWHGYAFVSIKPEINDAPNLNAASSWAREQINEANYWGLIPQSLQSAYTQNISRAEFCALGVTLYETAMGREITKRKTFSDTSDVNVEKMAGLGAVTGVGENMFDPGAGLTREQAATMLSRLATLMGRPLPDADAAFSDINSVSSWATQAVGRMQASGIMGGVGNNAFDPQGSYTREQSIATILRLYDIMR